MQNVNLAIPTDVMYEVKAMPSQGPGASEKIQIYLAIGLFVSRAVSVAKAANIAGQTLMEFMGTLKFLGIPAYVYTEEMYEEDQKFVNAEWQA
jgi:predicted HTH domain antitoxin